MTISLSNFWMLNPHIPRTPFTVAMWADILGHARLVLFCTYGDCFDFEHELITREFPHFD